jgi:hypothetical protein
MLTVYFLFVVENWVSYRVGFRGRAGRVTGASREEGVIQSWPWQVFEVWVVEFFLVLQEPDIIVSQATSVRAVYTTGTLFKNYYSQFAC